MTYTKEQVLCQYCNKPAQWVENKEIYGRNYGKSYMMYWCKPCDAYVGCHNNTKIPKGTLANKELREWRKKAHAHIDPIWQSGELARGQVYSRLKNALGREIHIGEADVETCKAVLNTNIAGKRLENMKPKKTREVIKYC